MASAKISAHVAPEQPRSAARQRCLLTLSNERAAERARASGSGVVRVPVRAAGVEASHFGHDFVVLDAQGQMIRGLNGTGARVFELVDGVRSEPEIAREIAREFDVDEAQAQQDVRAFLESLAQMSLIRFEDRSAPDGPREVTP